ncbi:AMP-binding protein [Maritimibacter alkaliphilus]|uniref:AMP-binding protein n=1 Tax=Maritimibacter alkaliphilus TaxID=404236 RepID=UPI001C96D8AF|nr:AMP-binding protein [Maritimibacter alkaliphilus]MBY6092846.1 AMP-binding protein [Maritimibacter alkaliphilus]
MPPVTDTPTTSKGDAFRGMSVTWLLDQWVQRQPDKTFVIWAPFDQPARQWTYAEMAREAKRFAAGLHARGVGEGDFVLMHHDNAPEFLGAWLGCAYVGAVPVTTNTRSVAENVAYFAELMQPAAAITQPSLAALVREACGPDTPTMVTGDPATEYDAEALGATPIAEVFSDGPLPDLAVDHTRNFAVQFTSGTTSRPKPTVWTNANALWGGKTTAMTLRLRRDDVTLLYLPLFHANAQVTFFSALWAGNTVVVHPRFSASRFWDTCATHGVTWVSMIPFAFKALSGRPVPEHRVHTLIGLAHLPDAEAEFRTRTMALWGMTETGTAAIMTDADHPGPAGTMGRPLPHYDVEVRTSDGTPAGPGEEGLLYIRGERGVSLFKEYYQQPEKTAEAFDASGALDTGDIVRIDTDGWLFFVNRDKDMLRVGGENVAALEIETAILETGLVLECAVVAQKHHMLGDIPAAFVSTTDAGQRLTDAELSDRILAHCTEKLADFKVPRSVHVVDDFPRSTLDRIAKNKLRDRLPAVESD